MTRSQEWDSDSVASEWDSSDPGKGHSQNLRKILGKSEQLPQCGFLWFSWFFLAEIPRELQGLPRSELQFQRKQLLMELLWIQQAIASRKHVRSCSCSSQTPLPSLFQGFGWLWDLGLITGFLSLDFSLSQFLMLKQKLGFPNHPGSIPEFLDWCGEALELQHHS